jgi:urea carboxylase-associated protein 2
MPDETKTGLPAATATLEQARAHARAQVQAAATAAALARPPDGVDADAVTHDDLIGAGDYAALSLPRGAHLRIADADGDACVALLVYNAHHTAERVNVADTVKVQWQAYLGEGAVLLSDMGRALATLVADTSRRHDALCGTTTLAANERRYGHGGIHGPSPAGRELFTVAGAKCGLGRRDLPPSINFFKGVRVHDDGGLELDGGERPGVHVELRAELDLLVLLVNVPHPLDTRPTYEASPVRITAWRSAPPAGLAATTPERARAYENTAQYLRSRP